jgi:hypothetical protein
VNTDPPRLAAALLRRLLTRAEHECVAGDLEEEYRQLVVAGSRYRARRWYWRQTLRSIAACRRRDGGGSMLRDMRFGVRLFRKHPLPVGIAAGGLGLAIAVVTSAFTIIDASLLRPYGMDDPG